MHTLIVYESMFGNTRRIAEAIAEALRATGSEVTVAGAVDAPSELEGFDLVVVGAPTHGHTLPQPSSRAEAVAWAKDPVKDLAIEAGARGPGVREWIERILVTEPMPRIVAFSTRADFPVIFAGDAAVTIKRRLHQLDVDVDSHEDFLVDFQNRLLDGEQQRAGDWAITLAPGHTSDSRVTHAVAPRPRMSTPPLAESHGTNGPKVTLDPLDGGTTQHLETLPTISKP